jgi:phage shock protein C
MTARRTKFYLDRQNKKWKGVCAGIAEYTGIDVTWVRVATVLVTIMGAFPWTLIAYCMKMPMKPNSGRAFVNLQPAQPAM